MGRHSTYTKERGDKICERLANGESMRAICKEKDMPDINTVNLWIRSFEDFKEQYFQARRDQADYYAQQIVDISDETIDDTYFDDHGNKRIDPGAIARARLRIDARKWYASKLNPTYNDKVEVSGNKESPLVVEIVRYSQNEDENGKKS